MGNQHSSSHGFSRPRKNVHWKSAGRPAVPGKPDIIPISSEDEPNAITLRWIPSSHNGGAPLKGYQVECNRVGSREWIRTSPPIVLQPELILTGLEDSHRYQFRVAAFNAVGRSEYSEISDILNINWGRYQEPPIFLHHLEDITALENDKTEFKVSFTGMPIPTISWFKDDYEIFSSRRTAITTDDSSSILVFHQTLSSDEGEIKCTATNRAGHAVTKARLSMEAAPKLRYPRQYEDGLLYEINETIFLKTSVIGKPPPVVEWRHDGLPIILDARIEISNTSKFSMLKIHSARRNDRGEYQINAKNNIGEDSASFLVTVTAPPDSPRRVLVTRQVDKSVTLDWEPPIDDGGCRIGNYIIEYYRSGWNVWLKATTSRKTSVTLFDLIEGSEYRFRVKAESPYGVSAPSVESSPVRIPGRAVDMDFLSVESKIINDVLTREDGEDFSISPVPRRRRMLSPALEEVCKDLSVSPVPRRRRMQSPALQEVSTKNKNDISPYRDERDNEFILVLYPGDKMMTEKNGKRHSFQLDPEDAISPPPISLSAPDLSSRNILPFRGLRNAVSSTELLHEHAMDRFYKVVAIKEEQTKQKNISHEKNVVLDNSIKIDLIKEKIHNYDSFTEQRESEISHKWQSVSFDEDYTASTVSTEPSDDGSLHEIMDRENQFSNEEDIYNPRNKLPLSSYFEETIEDEKITDSEILKPLPDPSFRPKPILKRRVADEIESKRSKNNIDKIIQKEGKTTLFKNITKMPVTKVLFPKLVKKKEVIEPVQTQLDSNASLIKNSNTDDVLKDEGNSVIDYYGNIVREYGTSKKLATPLYLTTNDLKNVAEKQEVEKEILNRNTNTTLKSQQLESKAKKNLSNKLNVCNSTLNKTKHAKNNEKTKSEYNNYKADSKNKLVSKENLEHTLENITQEIILKNTERATIVIPINYRELEEKAKINVRSAIDYTVDVCLLILAFWVYFFKDERLAIPFLTLIIYRQLQETILLNMPDWIERHIPSWLNIGSGYDKISV